MGILNVTPDSFSDGGAYLQLDRALAHAADMMAEGADVIDVGGESTRPGAQAVPAAEQIRRIEPVIAGLRARHPQMQLSVDTQSAIVARRALAAGVTMINDVSALRGDPEMATVVADAGATVILMHMQGSPPDMQDQPRYHDVVAEVGRFLEQRVGHAVTCGIPRERIWIDPGIGFGKTVSHNLQLLAELHRLVAIAPVVLGTSRKSFIAKTLEVPWPERELTGMTVTHVLAVLAGVSMLRVHDVRAARQTVQMCTAVRSAGDR